MPADNFRDQAKSAMVFGSRAEVITPGASALTKAYKYIVAGATGGTVTCRDTDDLVDLVFYLNAGQVLPFRPYKITAAVATPLIGVIE